MHREPEVPEARVPVEECFDCRARITSKELAITHSVKNGTLQNACSTRGRVVVGLRKNAHTHTARLTNNLAKGPKIMVTKVQWYVENYTTIGLRISRYGAAEVFIDLTEELKHTETNTTCEIHESYCASH